MEGNKETGKSKEIRVAWHKEIKNAKVDMWKQWIEEGKDVWLVARVAKNPFGSN